MSNSQFDSESSESDNGTKKSCISTKLNQLQDLIDDLIVADTIESRQSAISNLYEFLCKWRKQVNAGKSCDCRKYSTKKKSNSLKENRPKLAIFWNLFGGSGKGTPLKMAARNENSGDESETSMSAMPSLHPRVDDEFVTLDTTSANSSSSGQQKVFYRGDDSQVYSKTEYSFTAKADPINIPSDSSDHDCNCSSIVSHSMAIDDEENQEEFVPSLKLMTCESISKGDDQPSMVAKSANIPGYESEKSYESYRLQTVNDMPQVHESDTLYSTGAVSSCQMSATVQTSPKDDPLATHYDPQIFDGQDLKAIIAQRVKALLTNDSQYELDGDDLGVEILEIAPLTENDSQMNAADTAGTVSQREEIESLKSKNGGFVRQMINAFSRFKN